MACGLCKHCDYAGDLGTCYYYNTGDDPENECYGTGACGGTCNGSGSCQYPSTSVTCSALQDCDYLNYYYQDPSTDSAVGTDRCYYRDYADTYRYCNGAGSCSALNCSSYSNPYQYECGTCKYIPSNYCVGDYKGSCANWSQGGSCGTDKECDGSGNCVDCADPTGTISTSKTTVDIGEQFTITVNGYDDNDVWYLYVRENDGDWQSQQCLYTQTSCTKTWNFTKSSADTYRYYGLVMDSDDVHSCSDYHESATVPQYIDIEVVQPLSPNGDSCAIGADCQSGYCEDDVCCVNACSGTCRHCNATPGTCTYIPIGEDPDSECSGFSVCNGSGSCTTCSSLSYPTDYWQRAWYTWDGNCLGNGPNENAVQFDNNWGTNAPAYGISDNIQFQSSRSIYFADAGIYRFSLVHDDGVKLYINDNLKIDEWQAGSDTHKVDVNLTAGWHDFRIDWFEATGNARIGFSYEVSTGCPAYCASLGYTYAECYGPLCRSYDQCGDQCVDGVAYDWWDSGGQNGCWWPQKCWCRNIYSDVECGRNYIASGMSTVQSYGCGDDEDPTTGCCIKFSLFEEGGQGSTKGACGYGEPLNPTKAFAECKLGSCSSASGHNGENCTIFRNCNNEWQNSPTNFVEMDGNYYDWSLATEYVGGKWDASNKQCVKCSGNKKTHKYGDTTTLSYVTCFETISPSGDIPDVCESACGADPDCDEKNTGDSCDTGKTCNSTCQCVSSDISPPEVTITGPTTHQKDDFTITINYSDNQAGDSGLATCLYQIRRGGVVVYPTVGDWTSAGNCADKSSDGYNKNIPVGPTEYCREPAGGGCEVRTYVIDNAGKDGGDVQIFNIDYTPPETEIY